MALNGENVRRTLWASGAHCAFEEDRHMERLSGMDAAFLYLETPAGHMHVAMTAIYDASKMEGGYSFERIKETIIERLPLVPPFRRRLVEVPMQFHHPVWIEDPDFDIENHVHRVTCPAPGGRRELALIAGQIASEPLDRSRPLWEAWIIEDLKHDRFGFVAKVHHATIDGAAGAEIMTELFDISPDGREIDVEPVPTERVPSDLELLSYAAVSKAKLLGDAAGLIGRTARSVNQLVSGIRNPDRTHGAIPLTAPRTPFNASITPDRSVAFARVSLDEIKAVKGALGVKVNDVVLAICAGTLRTYLEGLDALPDEALLAVCPVSVRTDEQRGTQGNHVSAMFASLATDIDDPLDRIQAIANSTVGAKEDHNAIGATTLTDWAEWAAPRSFGLAARLYSSMNLANAHRPIHNLVISNVPGPPFPLYLAGAELVAAYPMGPIMDGAGLNITVMSYRGNVDFGFLASTELVPDVWDVAGAVTTAFDEIKEAAGRADPTLVKRPAPVTPTRKRAPVITAASRGNGSLG